MTRIAMVPGKADRSQQTMRPGVLAGVLTCAFALMPASVQTADTAPGGTAAKSSAVTFENVPGSKVKRIVLAAKAAERLGIETGKVSEDIVVRRQMVGGLIIPALDKQAIVAAQAGGSFGGFAAAPAQLPPAMPSAKPAVATPGVKPAAGSFGGFGKGPSTPAPKPGGTFGGVGKGVMAPAPAVGAVAGASNAPASQSAAQAPRFEKVATASQAVSPQLAAAQPSGPQPAIPLPKMPAKGEVWVHVTLSAGEWERLAKDKPARVLPLATRDRFDNEVLAKPAGIPPIEDVKRSMLTVYYIVPGKDHGLFLNSRVRVELPLAGSEDKQKVVPYGAVYYDSRAARGSTSIRNRWSTNVSASAWNASWAIWRC